MSFLNKLAAFLPFGRKVEEKEYFFALNIGQQNLEAALWELEGKNLHVLESSNTQYSSLDEIIPSTDKLLDNVLGVKEIEPQKILFGVLDSWLSEDDLKEEYLRLLRNVVKELELSPMAYVATSHAIIHFLENKDGVPTTAILVGFEELDLTVTVCRAGKLDGSKVFRRTDNPGFDIEKALLNFTNIETLPSKILIYGKIGQKLEKVRGELLSFPWMAKLSFLHFPKIDILDDDIEIKSVCLAGAKELKGDAVLVSEISAPKSVTRKIPDEEIEEKIEEEEKASQDSDLGFVVGDVSENKQSEELDEVEETEKVEDEETKDSDEAGETEESIEDTKDKDDATLQIETQNIEQKMQEKNKELMLPSPGTFSPFKKISSLFRLNNIILWVSILIILALFASYLTLPKAIVKVFVEPQILEKDAQVTADPKRDTVDEDARIIPAKIIQTEISGTGKGEVTGKKEVGDPAKGTVVVRNKTSEPKTLSQGTILSSASGIKFKLDVTVNVASISGEDGTWGKGTGNVTAQTVGADGNLPSGADLTVSNFTSSQIIAKAEGNFSGGTSKQVSVVSTTDQDKLLAQVAQDLRGQAQQKLQEGLDNKKILEEALSEEIVKKSFSKNISDQATELSLNLTVRYKGAAFEDSDLKKIVSKLVTTDVPEGFELNISETETQADVSKLEKDGKLVFLARFRAKLIPKLDLDKIRKEVKGKTPFEVSELLKGKNHILGSEVIINPTLPSILQRLPILERNIQIEVGLK